MSSYTGSKRNQQDIQDIIKRSLQDFGEAQTLKYMAGLKSTLQTIAENPDFGRTFTHRRTGIDYRHYACISHEIYYRKLTEDVFIVRIMHRKMLPDNHL